MSQEWASNHSQHSLLQVERCQKLSPRRSLSIRLCQIPTRLIRSEFRACVFIVFRHTVASDSPQRLEAVLHHPDMSDALCHSFSLRGCGEHVLKSSSICLVRQAAWHFPRLLPPSVLEDHGVAMGGTPLDHHSEPILLDAALLFGRHLHLTQCTASLKLLGPTRCCKLFLHQLHLVLVLFLRSDA